jgi:hypothetical protein
MMANAQTPQPLISNKFDQSTTSFYNEPMKDIKSKNYPEWQNSASLNTYA